MSSDPGPGPAQWEGMADHRLSSGAAFAGGLRGDVASWKGDDGTRGAFSWLLHGTDPSQEVHRHSFEGLFNSFIHLLIYSSDMYIGPTVC